MSRRSLRTQLLAMGLVAAVVPLLLLLIVVFQVEESETIDAGSDGSLEVVSESGVSPWIPLAALLLAAAASALVWLWAKRAVDPIERMTALTDDVQAGSLDRRLDLGGAPIEIRTLAESFDRMLDRLAATSESERRLIEDASHDLRTPLAALAARIEIAGRRTDATDVQRDLARCEEEIERLQTTLDALLVNARSRQTGLEQVDNDLVAIVRRVVERQRLASPGADITVHTPERLLLGIDGAVVERAVANLVANAVDHGGPPVQVEVTETSEWGSVRVTDDGPGIDRDRVPSLFDRYSGADHGIGLAVVKQVADAYGDITIESPVHDDRGTRFVLTLWGTANVD